MTCVVVWGSLPGRQMMSFEGRAWSMREIRADLWVPEDLHSLPLCDVCVREREREISF